MPPPLVQVNNVSKKFARSLKRAMTYGLIDIAKAAFIPHRFRSSGFNARLSDLSNSPTPELQNPPTSELPGARLRATEFWACRNISFNIQRGECLGIIGPNGAGKSTVFKLLSGIYGPTEGSIEMRGQLSALLEVGAGFHHILSGRENIYISGAIRGMTTEEINRKYDQIVAFSGVGDFIDMPIKFYSSGMLVRLGFAVLAHLEPDILLIDEILAVGDMAFQKQCIDHINKLRESDMAIALVSHSLYRIESLCQRAIWLDHGQVVMEGGASSVIQAYRDRQLREQREIEDGRQLSAESSDVVVDSPFFAIHSVHPLNRADQPVKEYAYGEDLRFRIRFTAKQRIESPLFNLVFKTRNVGAFEAAMLIDGNAPEYVKGPGEIICEVHHSRLLPNNYTVELFIRSREGVTELIEMQQVCDFTITSDGLERLALKGPYSLGHLSHGRILYPEYTWQLGNAVTNTDEGSNN